MRTTVMAFVLGGGLFWEISRPDLLHAWGGFAERLARKEMTQSNARPAPKATLVEPGLEMLARPLLAMHLQVAVLQEVQQGD